MFENWIEYFGILQFLNAKYKFHHESTKISIFFSRAEVLFYQKLSVREIATFFTINSSFLKAFWDKNESKIVDIKVYEYTCLESNWASFFRNNDQNFILEGRLVFRNLFFNLVPLVLKLNLSRDNGKAIFSFGRIITFWEYFIEVLRWKFISILFRYELYVVIQTFGLVILLF